MNEKFKKPRVRNQKPVGRRLCIILAIGSWLLASLLVGCKDDATQAEAGGHRGNQPSWPRCDVVRIDHAQAGS